MGTPYIGEIRLVGFNFAPQGWAACDGQVLAISQNDALFNLIGTTYGGDGQQTFALPNLQGRVPIHQGQGPGLSSYVIGEASGVESVTLTTNQIPAHSHLAQAQTGSGNQTTPSGGVWANSGQGVYAAGPATLAMKNNIVGAAGGSQPHDNMMPYEVINFVISLFGVYPSQN